MKARTGILGLVLAMFAAGPAFAGSTSFSFGFGGPDMALGTSQSYTSNGATITAYGYECSAATPSSTDTLSNCGATELYQKMETADETGLGLADENDHEIGWDGPDADFVIGLDVSALFKLGATSMTLSFGSVQPGEAYAIFGYDSNPFGSSFDLNGHLVNGQLVGNDGSTNALVFSSTIGLNADDQFLVFTSPCSAQPGVTPPCGSNVLLGSATASTPEPGTLALFATGLLALGFGMRRRFAFQRQ
ncbi:MAG TPA: PEP-CTERM sorting domain-containing protein [Candidatus Acidoferrales bacterium]|nr:PEP-CTERM sorting domain-containing protein [Candidatus Acidoferrales bacterium]